MGKVLAITDLRQKTNDMELEVEAYVRNSRILQL